MPVSGATVGKQLCDALGLHAEVVESVHISVKANDVVRVLVSLTPTQDQFGEIIRVLKSYTLEEHSEVTDPQA